MKNLIWFLFFIPVFGYAQKSHTVAAKESLYSIGRMYNIHPRELAAYNNISLQTGLTIGQVIQIPAKATIPPVNTTAAPEKTIAPVTQKTKAAPLVKVPQYHKVAKKETLYHISKLYKNVTIDDIKKWNKLSSDGLSEGMNLVVGYKMEKQANAEEQTKQEVAIVPAAKIPEPAKIPEAPQSPPVEPKPVIAEPVKEEPRQEIKDVVRVKPVETLKQESPGSKPGKRFNGGYFKGLYDTQAASATIKEESGTAGVFKSTSGWDDGKYYCLHDTAPAGSIVKITNTATQKTVYAKVLDVMPDLKQNVGLMLRLSNAAADELGAGENNFDCTIVILK
jgi:LysM repeat protein